MSIPVEQYEQDLGCGPQHMALTVDSLRSFCEMGQQAMNKAGRHNYNKKALQEIQKSLQPYRDVQGLSSCAASTISTTSGVSSSSNLSAQSHDEMAQLQQHRKIVLQLMHLGYDEDVCERAALLYKRGACEGGLLECVYQVQDARSHQLVGLTNVMRRGSPVESSIAGSSDSPPPPPPPRTQMNGPATTPPPNHQQGYSPYYGSHVPVQMMKQRISPSPSNQRGTSPTSRTQRGTSPKTSSSVSQQQQMSQQLQALSIYTDQPPPPPYPRNRASPSPGGSSNGSITPAPPLGMRAAPLPAYTAKPGIQHPIIMQSVKSTQVQKPVLQTACAPVMPVPTTDPPSYVSTIAALAVQRQATSCAVTAAMPLISYADTNGRTSSNGPSPVPPPPPPSDNERPPMPLPRNVHPVPPPPPRTDSPQRPSVSPSHNAPYPPPPVPHAEKPPMHHPPTSQAADYKMTHHSPIPERKLFSMEKEEERRDCRVRIYSPQAFKFFMEQRMENIFKCRQQREQRRKQLEKEMAKVGLSDHAQVQMRKMLSQKESNYMRLKRAKMDKKMFVKLKTIGVGAFGEVALVKKIDTNHLYAMKTLRKNDVYKKKQAAHVKAERDILAEADNEWVVKLYYSFQDKDNLYFVMDYIPGGDLMSLLIKFGIFTEELARFYIAELVEALASVHKMGFIHRDIKPDNILIDRDGHIKLTDFGLCTGFRWTHDSKYYQNDSHGRQDSMDLMEEWKEWSKQEPTAQDDDGGRRAEEESLPPAIPNKPQPLKLLERRRKRARCLAHSLVGTPNYIAPEVLLRTGYTQLCDWWSVGVILYEMLVGQPPFLASTAAETQIKVINYKQTLVLPDNKLSPDSKDLISRLCTGAEERIGCNDATDIKAHRFFKNLQWDGGLRNTPAPYIPTISFATDTSNFDPIDPSKLRASRDASDDQGLDNAKIPEHAFFEFTFRRFFDEGGHPYPLKFDVDNNNVGARSNPVFV